MDHPWFLVMVVFCLTLFGCVLAYVSYEETRDRRRELERRKEREAASLQPKGASGSSILVK